MTCYTLDNCTSWPHCGSACDGKGCSYLQMSSDTRHKIIFQTSSKITSFPFRISAPTAVNRKKLKYRSKHHFPFHKHQDFWHLLINAKSKNWGSPPPLRLLITNALVSWLIMVVSNHSNNFSHCMTCCIVGNCTSWSQCGSACDGKGCL